jgi:alpha,alpha-trehalase
MAVHGLRAYGHTDLAGTIRERWLKTVEEVYLREGKLVEKYALREAPQSASMGGGGEYPLQDGFGWTNGVVRHWLSERGPGSSA